jgi:hypothetical protein
MTPQDKDEIEMESPPNVSGTRRAISDNCDVILNDTDTGVALIVDNRDELMYTMRFNFEDSTNLSMEAAKDGVVTVAALRCSIDVQPGTVRNLCELNIVDFDDAENFQVRYKVQCLVKNERGELVQVAPPSGKPSGATAQPQQQQQAAAAADGDGDNEERTKLAENLYIIVRHDPGTGYTVELETTGAEIYHCKVNFSNCENLAAAFDGAAKKTEAMKCDVTVAGHTTQKVAALTMVDKALGGYAIEYGVRQTLDVVGE